MNRVIDKLVCLDVTPERKLLIAYSDAIRFHYRGKLGRGARKRVGWCFESMVKQCFRVEIIGILDLGQLKKIQIYT